MKYKKEYDCMGRVYVWVRLWVHEFGRESEWKGNYYEYECKYNPFTPWWIAYPLPGNSYFTCGAVINNLLENWVPVVKFGIRTSILQKIE